MATCPFCKTDIHSEATVCPNCSAFKTTNGSPAASKFFGWALLLLGGLMSYAVENPSPLISFGVFSLFLFWGAKDKGEIIWKRRY